MKRIESKSFDEERAFYGEQDLIAVNCKIDGPKDGESAFKECTNITNEKCFYNLRYPFWHNHYLKIIDSHMTELCRAAIWYSENIAIQNTKMYGIKALRECSDILIENCSIVSPEFGWSCRNVIMTDTNAKSEYFFLRSEKLQFKRIELVGKYSFQYITDSTFENCNFDTKDAFWHSHHVTVKNSILKGEYLAWYSNDLTLINCNIIGTQPFCYCNSLTLINCEMIDTDLCFEKSDVKAEITTPVISIKNPKSGCITVAGAGEIIRDDKNSKCKIIVK